jgi:predicted small secreted protein
MKKTILICGLLVIGLALLGGCYPYNTRGDLGADYYGSPYYSDVYDPFYVSAGSYPSYPYYYPYYYYPAYYPAYYYPYYYYPYFYPYPYFSVGFGFEHVFHGGFERGGRVFRGSAGTSGGRSGRSFRR